MLETVPLSQAAAENSNFIESAEQCLPGAGTGEWRDQERKVGSYKVRVYLDRIHF